MFVYIWSSGGIFWRVVSCALASLAVRLHRLIKQHGSFRWGTQLRPQRAAPVQLQHLLQKEGTTKCSHKKAPPRVALQTIKHLELGLTHRPAEKDNVCGLAGLCASFPVQCSDFIRRQRAAEDIPKTQILHYIFIEVFKSNFHHIKSKAREWGPDVKLSTRSASAGVVQSDSHQDRLSQGAQRNIHLQTGWRKFLKRIWWMFSITAKLC